MNNVLLLSLIALCCLTAHWAIQRDPAHPGVVHGVLWLGISLGYTFFQSELNPLSNLAVLTLALGLLTFSAGLVAGGHVPALKYQPQDKTGQMPLLPIIVLISAIGLVLMVFQAIDYVKLNASNITRPDGSIVLVGDKVSWYLVLRYELISNHKGSLGFSSYILNFCFAGVAYLILYVRRVHKTWWLWPTLSLALGFALLSTGRTFVLLLACIGLAAAMPASSHRRWRIGAAALLLGSAAFFVLPWLQGRFFLGDKAFQSMVLSYFFMPMAAFDHLLNAGMPTTQGGMTFRTPLAVLRALGASVAVPDLMQPFIKVPAEINVYTVFSPYYRDFGLSGIALFMLLLGGLHGWVYRQLKSGNPVIVVANALLFYALLMQFFQDQYFGLMSQWIQIIGWIYLFNRLQPLPNSSAGEISCSSR